MKILLIVPNDEFFYSDFPQGLLYIASYIRKNKKNVDIRIFDEESSQLEKYLKEFKPDLIGIFAVVTNLDNLRLCMRIARLVNPYSKIVIGGPACVTSEEHLKSMNPDFIVLGEGETTFLEIVNYYIDESKYGSIPNIIYKKNGVYQKNSIQTKRIDLEKEDMPDFDLIDVEKYVRRWFYFDYMKNIRGISMIASRGCPYNCSFCQPTLKHLFGTKVRYHDPDKIVEKMKELHEKYSINAFFFHDDTFTLNKKFVERLCDRLLKENLEIIWGCNSRVDCITDEACSLMYKAGCREIRLGIESFNKDTLNFFEKEVDEGKLRESLSIIKKNNINSFGFIIIGAPNEKITDILNTLFKSTASSLDLVRISILTSLPGTKIDDKKRSKIRKDKDYNYIKSSRNNLSSIPFWILRLLKNFGYIIFYLHSKRFLRFLKMNGSLQKIKYKLERL